MKLCLKFKLLAFCCFMVTFESYSQVEFSGLAGPAFHYAVANHSLGLAGTATRGMQHGINRGYAGSLEAKVPMKHGFRLKAGFRLMSRTITWKRFFNYSGYTIQNTWFLKGLALETPVHLSYQLVDRKFQIEFGAGASAVKNWIDFHHSNISWSGNGTTVLNTNSFFGNALASSYQPERNGLSVAAELSAEIRPAAYPRFSLAFVWHQDFIKKMGRVMYEDQNYAQTGNSSVFGSKEAFRIEDPGYWMVQLKYTFAGKPKDKATETKDFEEESSE